MDSLCAYAKDYRKPPRLCKYCGGAEAFFLWTHTEITTSNGERGATAYGRKPTKTYLCANHAEHWAKELGLPWPVQAIKFDEKMKPRAARRAARKRRANPNSIQTIFTKYKGKKR